MAYLNKRFVRFAEKNLLLMFRVINTYIERALAMGIYISAATNVRGNGGKGEKKKMEKRENQEIIRLLKKQNALLVDISKKLGELLEASKDEEIRDKAREAMANCGVPELLDNEKTLETCHVIKDGVRFTFHEGRLVEKRDANKSDYYLYRKAV